MSEAEWILWFGGTACLGGSLSYLVRGLLGERVRWRVERPTGRCRFTPALLWLACALFLVSAAAFYGAWFVNTWFGWGIQHEHIVIAITGGLALPCFVLLTLGFVGRRPWGTKRCRRCWYDMTGCGLRCPECGGEVSSHNELLKTRRRRWPFAVSGLLLLLSVYTFTHGERIARVGWKGGIPTTVLILGWRWLPHDVITRTDFFNRYSLEARILWRDPPNWWLDRSTRAALNDADSIGAVIRAVLLRSSMYGERAWGGPNISEKSVPESSHGPILRLLLARMDADIPEDEQEWLAWIAHAWLNAGGRITRDEAAALLADYGRGERLPEHAAVLLRSLGSIGTSGAEAWWAAIRGGRDASAPPLLLHGLGNLVRDDPLLVREMIDRSWATDPADRSTALLVLGRAAMLGGAGIDAQLMPLASLATEMMHDQEPEVRSVAAALLDALPAVPTYHEGVIAILGSDDQDRWRMIPDELPEGGSDALFEAVAWCVADDDRRVADRAQGFVVRTIEQMSARRDPALLRRALRLRRIARSLDVWSYDGLPGRVVMALADAGIEIGYLPRTSSKPVMERRFTFIWRRAGGSYGEYDALVQHPEPDDDTGYAVMLFGGGLTTDLHWTVPGSINAGEGVRRLTLDGEPIRDGDTLARALVDAGFKVLRYSGVFEGNPRFTPDPTMRAPMGFEDSVSLARAAIDGFRREHEIPAGGLILLGHSLGATRACLMEDEDIAGFVLLAPAYMSKTAARPSVLSGEAISRHGVEDMKEAVRRSPEMAVADRDGDGIYRGWELAAWDRSRGAIEIESESATWRGGLSWPSDRLIERSVPTLALFGGLDPTSVHGPWLEAAATDGRLADCRVVYFPNRGHNLAREVEERIGPFDPAVIETLIRWLDERFGGRE